MKTPARRVRAIVFGSGPAAAAAALCLLRAGELVFVVANRRAQTVLRDETLPAIAQRVLAALNLLDRFLSQGYPACPGTLSFWEDVGGVSNSSIRDPYGHGWHVDRTLFAQFLLEELRLAGVSMHFASADVRIERSAGTWLVRVDEVCVEADWLVDASGRAGTLARKMGVRRQRIDRLVSVACPIRLSRRDVDRRVVVEAVPEGWWYTSVGLSGKRCAAFFTDSDLLDRRILTPHGFRRALSAAGGISNLFGDGYQVIDSPATADAATTLLQQVTGDGWLSAGDAAFTLDPLTSQGMFSALYTGLQAGNALIGKSTVETYSGDLHRIFCAYLANRATYYAAGARWRSAPFWRRRIAQERFSAVGLLR